MDKKNKENELPREVKRLLEQLVHSFESKLSRQFSNVKIRERHYAKDEKSLIYRVTCDYSFEFNGKTFNEQVSIAANYDPVVDHH